jgi:hypothetical protein
VIVLPVQAFLPLPPSEPLPRLALLRHKVRRAVALHHGNRRLLRQTPRAAIHLAMTHWRRETGEGGQTAWFGFARNRT